VSYHTFRAESIAFHDLFCFDRTIFVSVVLYKDNMNSGIRHGNATLHLEMQSPVWVEFDTVELYINNIPVPYDDDGDAFTPPQYQASPNVVLTEGVDFTVTEVNDHPGIPGARHSEAEVDYALGPLSQDTWVVALVRGTDGISHPLFPVVPNDIPSETNPTLSDLLDGNLGEAGILSLSFTNPLFIDVNGNGVYDAPSAP